MRQLLNYSRHPLSQLNFKGGSESESDQQTSSTTTESSTTQGGSGQQISVSNGGTVVTDDNATIENVLSFAGGVLDPIISDLNDAVAGAQQIAENSLNLAANATQAEAGTAASGASAAANIAATAEQNAQLGYSGIFENPVFIIGAVAVVGLIVWLSNKK